MPSIPLSPTTLPTGQRRRQPWRNGSTNYYVPLWTAKPEGDVVEGLIRVPKRLAYTQEHTNERLEFNRLIVDNLERWVSWRAARGWIITERPTISGPFEPPLEDEKTAKKFQARAEEVIGKSAHARAVTEFDHAEEILHYYARARFKRETPQYVSLEDMLEIQDQHALHGVDPNADTMPWNDTSGTADTGWVNPLEYAEARRKSLGLKRADYLMGDLSDPL